MGYAGAGSILETAVNINNQVMNPLAHALHMARGQFNEFLTKRWKKIAKNVRDSQLSRWLEDTEESLTDLFPGDISVAMDASRARRTDGLLLLASRAVSPSGPTPLLDRVRPVHQQLPTESAARNPTLGNSIFEGGRSRQFGSWRRQFRSSSHGQPPVDGLAFMCSRIRRVGDFYDSFSKK